MRWHAHRQAGGQTDDAETQTDRDEETDRADSNGHMTAVQTATLTDGQTVGWTDRQTIRRSDRSVY